MSLQRHLKRLLPVILQPHVARFHARWQCHPCNGVVVLRVSSPDPRGIFGVLIPGDRTWDSRGCCDWRAMTKRLWSFSLVGAYKELTGACSWPFSMVSWASSSQAVWCTCGQKPGIPFFELLAYPCSHFGFPLPSPRLKLCFLTLFVFFVLEKVVVPSPNLPSPFLFLKCRSRGLGKGNFQSKIIKNIPLCHFRHINSFTVARLHTLFAIAT